MPRFLPKSTSMLQILLIVNTCLSFVLSSSILRRIENPHVGGYYGNNADDGENVLSIDLFGAMPNNNTYEAALANGGALMAAMSAANNSVNGSRTVLIPANSDYYMLPAGTSAGLAYLVNVTLLLEGTILAWTDDFDKWPQVDGLSLNLIQFSYCSNFTVTGNGVIDGQG